MQENESKAHAIVAAGLSGRKQKLFSEVSFYYKTLLKGISYIRQKGVLFNSARKSS